MNAEATQVVSDQSRRDRAMTIAERLCELAFANRRGHGNTADVVYRQMRPIDLKAFLITAFEAGAEWESKR